MSLVTTLDKDKLSELYGVYLGLIKPLLSEIEANYEQFPEPLFNEIRAFNDHISRCYIPNISQSEIDVQIEKAERHIHRMVLDCYKYLNVYYKIQIEEFEKQTRNIDLTSIDSGSFYIEYQKLKNNSIKAVREAKHKEYSSDGTIDFSCFEHSYNEYVALYDFICDNMEKVRWARAKYYTSKTWTLIVGVVCFVVGSAIKGFIPVLIEWLK